jgi:hypothetical protein
VLCLVFSIGAVQAQTGENNESQWGSLNTNNDVSMPTSKTNNLSDGSGGQVRWIPIGEDEKTFYTIEEPTKFSGNFSRISGTCNLNLTDLDPLDIKQFDNTSKAEFKFTDPTGNLTYGVILKNVVHVAEFISFDSCPRLNSSINECTETTVYSYGAVWGLGDLYVNGALVNESRVIRVMASERVNRSDKERYELLFHKESPRRGIETRLLLTDMVVTESGTVEKKPLPTSYTLPDGKKQSFINVIFDGCRLEGHKIFNFENVTGNNTEA